MDEFLESKALKFFEDILDDLIVEQLITVCKEVKLRKAMKKNYVLAKKKIKDILTIDLAEETTEKNTDNCEKWPKKMNTDGSEGKASTSEENVLPGNVLSEVMTEIHLAHEECDILMLDCKLNQKRYFAMLQWRFACLLV